MQTFGLCLNDEQSKRAFPLLYCFEFNYRPGPNHNIFWIPEDYEKTVREILTQAKIIFSTLDEVLTSSDF